MNKKYVILSVVVALCIGGGAFYGGMQYEKNVVAKTTSSNVRTFAGGNRQGGSVQDNQATRQGMGQNGGQSGNMRRGGQNGGGFVTGEILSKDDKSLTIKTPDGGSTIVYFSAAMNVRKADTGSLSDIVVGQQVMINGKNSPDGSIFADTLSIVPPIAK